MKRRPLPVAAALAATAALLLTACGSGDADSKANDKIAGVGGTDDTASPHATASNSAQRPKITLPNDVTNVFEGWKTGDATKDAVLTDASRRIDALAYAITQGDTDEPVLGYYYKGDALVGASQWVKEFADAKKSMTGETRYFNPRVDLYATSRATLTYCSFEGKAFVKDRESGKADKTPVTDRSYLLYSTRLEKNAKGVWQTAVLNSERGNKACTP
ncbi:hypothetical protein AB0E64_22525 [Streptomyces caelestis]|uniref:Lipoprotein n=1 Tax=Streptomyces caelestis TaxID=36816 RepID=A0A7W9LUI0_9ACTN|nr:hypothetical protein [Streptomyces caelestis]MBB5796765.1 hypothetical protein [Streptomyces caelestis]GGW33447.1 lipoprotein [Streptomyces caelestis]